MTETKVHSGFIVHPNYTGNNKYHASYGNHNKTQKSFSTLKAARAHLKREGIKTATYENSSGHRRTVDLEKRRRTMHHRNVQHHHNNDILSLFVR